MNNITSISIVLDQSGSMLKLMQDTLGSFNKFLFDQKELPGEALFSLCTFSDNCRVIHDCVSLASVEELTDKTYSPSGGTALLDAIGSTIERLKTKAGSLPENERPNKTVILIITDGEDNSSKDPRFTKDAIKKMVQDREKEGWVFIFIGASGIDAFQQGSSFGMGTQNSINYTPSTRGTQQLYSSVSASIGNYRSSNIVGATMDFMELKNAIENEKDIPVISNPSTPVPSKDIK